MRTRQWVLAVILLLLGMYFLDNLVSGHIYYYINMNFGWMTWLGTGVLLLLGVTNAFDLMREAPVKVHVAHTEHECCEEGEHEVCCATDDHHHEHDHSHSH